MNANAWDCLVEANLNAIHVDSVRKEVRVHLSLASSSLVRSILAIGVREFSVTEMRLSNIVDRVVVYRPDDATTSEMADRVFWLMRGRAPTKEELRWPPLIRNLAELQNGALTLLEIEPVYGAQISILAKTIELN
jgi:hypothetical protein